MSTNSKIRKTAMDAISIFSVKGTIKKVRLCADFSLANDEDYSLPEKIDNALSKIKETIRFIDRSNVVMWVCGTIMIALLVYMLVDQDSISKYWVMEAIGSIIVGITGIYFGVRGNRKRDILLFWIAHVDNLVDEHDTEIEKEDKDEVHYWIRKAMKYEI